MSMDHFAGDPRSSGVWMLAGGIRAGVVTIGDPARVIRTIG